MVKTNRGYTLIEIMFVIAIMATIMALAYPSYSNSIIRSQRTDMRVALTEISQALERYRTQNLSYLPINPVTVSELLGEPYIYGSFTYPTASYDRKVSNDVQYDLSLTMDAEGSTYMLTATPRAGSRQDGDGMLVIDHLGRTCWSQKVIDSSSGLKDTTCNASNNTGQGWNDK